MNSENLFDGARGPGKVRIAVLDNPRVLAPNAIARLGNEVVLVDYKTAGEIEMSVFHKGRMMVVALGAALGIGGVAVSGNDVLSHLANSSPGDSFDRRYGANPRSTGNGGAGRGNVMRSKRAAAKRRNKQARSGKGRPAKLDRKIAAQRARAFR